jgi:hypothetical protein
MFDAPILYNFHLLLRGHNILNVQFELEVKTFGSCR